MSFNLICSKCGAASGPSTGVCPFCKSIMGGSSKDIEPGIIKIQTYYNEGNIPAALTMITAIANEKPKNLEDSSFVVLYVKILFEAEAPSSQIKSKLMKVIALGTHDPLVNDYLELADAKTLLSQVKNDLGEQKLLGLLKRSPQNVHANFLLGAHLYWTEKQPMSAVKHLEKCVQFHPGFLRAWGCLGAIYESLGSSALASNAYRKCLAIETDSNMKKFFSERIEAVSK
jgi:hypothetical protein